MSAQDLRRLADAADRIATALEKLAGEPAGSLTGNPRSDRPVAPETFRSGTLVAIPMTIALAAQGENRAIYHAAHVLDGRFLPLYCGVEAVGEIATAAAQLPSEVLARGGRLCGSPGCRAQFR